MTYIFQSTRTCLDEHPPRARYDFEPTQVTIGDLHGNALKLIYFLCHEGVIDISDSAYLELRNIYNYPPANVELNHLLNIERIIADIKVISRPLVRLIGNELADLGSNDYYTLKILERLTKEYVPIEIILSNHGVEFIEAYERYAERNNQFEATMLEEKLRPSMTNLLAFIQQGYVSNEQVLTLVNSFYKPNLKLISYSLDDNANTISIYSHAAIDLEIIQAMAEKFDVSYEDNHAMALANTIERINTAFLEYVMRNQVHTLYDYNVMMQIYQGKPIDQRKHPIEYAMCNRNYMGLSRPHSYHGFNINYIHGHDVGNINSDGEHVISLYSEFGKGSDSITRTYLSLVSETEPTKPQLKQDDSATAQFQQQKLLILDLTHEIHTIAKAKTQNELAAAKALKKSIKAELENYQQKEISLAAFKINCRAHINQARQDLEYDKGWGQLLGNLLLAVLGLGVGYLIAGSVHYAMTGRFVFFPPATACKLDTVEQSVNIFATVALETKQTPFVI